MFDKFIQSLNNVQPSVWSFLQFVALLLVVGAGVVLLLKGHTAEGTPLMMAAFALLKNDVSTTGKSQ